MVEFAQSMAIVQRAQAEHGRTVNLADDFSDDDSIFQPRNNSRTAASASSAAAASSSTNNHVASTSTSSRRSPAASSASRSRAHGVPHMQGFVYVQDSSGIGRTGIRSAIHAAALTSIMQLAAANNEGGLLGSLGPGG
jgi:hypothetical protein